MAEIKNIKKTIILSVVPSVAFLLAGIIIISSVLSIFVKSNEAIDEINNTYSLGAYDGSVESFLMCAMSYFGTPYVWGGESPGVGLDCSGFVMCALKTSAGVEAPHSSREQYKSFPAITPTLDNLLPGDLLFFDWSTYNTPFNAENIVHVGIYLGNGWMVHTGNTTNNVIVQRVTTYENKQLVGATRPLSGGERVQTKLIGSPMTIRESDVIALSSYISLQEGTVQERLDLAIEYVNMSRNTSTPLDQLIKSKYATLGTPTSESDNITYQAIIGFSTFWRVYGFDQIDGTYSYDDFTLLAKVINAEARGESFEGQIAVGAVIMNRVYSKDFPNSIYDVVYQKGQFTCMDDGQINAPISDSALQAAQEVLLGSDPTGGCLYYYNPKTATSQWIFTLPVDVVIGNHNFSRG